MSSLPSLPSLPSFAKSILLQHVPALKLADGMFLNLGVKDSRLHCCAAMEFVGHYNVGQDRGNMCTIHGDSEFEIYKR